MALQFPSMPQPHQPSPDGLSNILFKVAAEKRARDEEARRMLLDQTRMQHEQQRMDQQDRISRTKDSLALNKEMQGTLAQGLPLLRDRPDQARALFAGHNAAIGNLPPEMQGGLRIDLPPPGPPPQNPGPAPQPGPAPIPQEGLPQQRAYAPSPSMQPAGAEQVDHPEAVRLDEPPPEGPETLGDQLARSAMIPVEMQMDRAERAKLEASNQQAQDQYAQAESAKQADYQKRREAYENPSYPIGIGGNQVVYHQREIEQAQAQERGRHADQMEAAILNDQNPWVQKYAPSLIDMYRGGMLDQKELGKSLLALRRDDMTAEQKQAALKQANDLAHYRGNVAVQVAHINADRPSLSLGEDRFVSQASKEVRDRTQASIEKTLKKNGVEDTNTAIGILDQIGLLLKSGNPDSQKTGLTQLITVKQNGDKRISNQDYNTMVQNAGGLMDTLEGAYNKLGKHGAPPSQIVKMALDTLGLLGGTLRQRQAGIARKVMRQHKDTSFYDPRLAKDILKTEIVGGENAVEEEMPGEVQPVGIAGPEAAGEARRSRVSASGSAVGDLKGTYAAGAAARTGRAPGAEDIEGAAKAHRTKLAPKAKKEKGDAAMDAFLKGL